MKQKICLIEDDPIMGEALFDRFELEGIACHWYRTAQEAWSQLLQQDYQVVISDICLPDQSGDALYEALLQDRVLLPPFIFITGHASIDTAIRLTRLGAIDYLTKPFDIVTLVDKINHLLQLKVRDLVPTPMSDCHLGCSSAMQHICTLLPRLAQHAKTILITGESGVGKEYVAKALHHHSGNRAAPFITINCAAISPELIESELFGHEKGAFTDAIRTKKGAFELANGGTLFLDEIGEASLSLQAKLLRAVQERIIMRVGGDKPIEVSLRLIFATHRDLAQRVQEGLFREDLYYRVQVIQLAVPPLRERLEDILFFAQQFLRDYAQDKQEPIKQLDPIVSSRMLVYPWPGNIRQLYNMIERACILSAEHYLHLSDFPELMNCSSESLQPVTSQDLTQYLHQCEREFIVHTLNSQSWQLGKVAELMGISRKNLWEKMKKLDIKQVDHV